jgi:hypothetical protein
VHVTAVVAFGLLTWAGSTLLLDAWWRRGSRPDLAERLRPFQPADLADEARQWLDKLT